VPDSGGTFLMSQVTGAVLIATGAVLAQIQHHGQEQGQPEGAISLRLADTNWPD
jgi:hypothetical protein